MPIELLPHDPHWAADFEATKLTLSAVLAGYVTARLARRAPMAHGLALGLVQTAAFGWALANVELRKWTPDWMWVALIVLTFAGILIGARLWVRRRSAVS